MNTQDDNIFDDKNKVEDEKSRPEITDEGSVSGSASDPEEIEAKNTEELAHEMGLYTDSNDEHPVELGLAEQINKAEGVIGDRNELEDEGKPKDENSNADSQKSA